MEKMALVIVGALIGIIPSLINKYFDTVSEQDRWKREQASQRKERFQAQLASAGKKLLTLQNSINWICWIASKTPDKLTIDEVTRYNQDIRMLLPDILAELVEIAVINEPAYEELNSVYEILTKVDARLSLIISQSIENNKIALKSKEEVDVLYNEILVLKGEVITKVKRSLNYNK